MKNLNILVVSVVTVFVLALPSNSAIDPKTAVGVWLFDEGVGDVATDSSGNNNHGKCENVKWVDGVFGSKALLFEGTGSVTVQSNDKLNLGSQLTMMAYFNAHVINDWHQLIAKNNQYLLRIDTPAEGKKMSAFVNLNGGWEPRASAVVPELNKWTHFAATYDSSTKKLKVFVNGQFSGESERTGNPTPNNDPVTFGHWNNGSRFRGVIDEVAIFSVALSEADIKTIADKGLKAALKIGGVTTSVSHLNKLTTTWAEIKR